MADVVRHIYPDSNRDLNLRSVVLFVIFTRRFLNNTRNESNICDNQGGLAIFSASDKMNSPLQLLVQAKNELTSVKVLLSDLQRKEIEELSVKNKRDLAYQEALSIQLNSAKKCNQILHKKFNSFVRFHDAVIDYEAE